MYLISIMVLMVSPIMAQKPRVINRSQQVFRRTTVESEGESAIITILVRYYRTLLLLNYGTIYSIDPY